MSSYSPFTVFLDMASLSKSQIFPTARVFNAPVGATPLEFHEDFWHQKTRVLAVVRRFLRDDIFNSLAVSIEHRLVTDI